jgi:outer membrane protein OmpA-like peptidoglycan-associated protein
MVAASAGLGACSVPDWANPVEWYRDATGVSEDDPQPDARNTQNLEKAGEEPYPNLASVPPPPTNALSAADREKLHNSLAADRANAQYVENNDQYVATAPKVVPSPPLSAPEAPPQTGAAPVAPVETTPAPVAQPQTSAAPAAAGQATPRAATRGTEKPAQESSLTSPSVRSVPQGETPRSAPPPPAGVSTQAPPAQRLPPAPQPPQTAALPPPAAPGYAGGVDTPPSGAGVSLGTVAFAGNSAKLSPEVLAQVRKVAALHQRNGGGTIRVTGYSVPQGEQNTMAPQLASFNLALDRARAVASALAQSGVPVRAVEIGASPPRPGQPGGVVEMSLEQ